MSADKCPHCGALRDHPNAQRYSCGTGMQDRDSACYLRELAATKRELEEVLKERQDFIDRDNAMKMAVQDDAERLRKAEARVRELEGFVRTVRDDFDCDHDAHKWKTFCRTCEASKLIGEAMGGGK